MQASRVMGPTNCHSWPLWQAKQTEQQHNLCGKVREWQTPGWATAARRPASVPSTRLPSALARAPSHKRSSTGGARCHCMPQHRRGPCCLLTRYSVSGTTWLMKVLCSAAATADTTSNRRSFPASCVARKCELQLRTAARPAAAAARRPVGRALRARLEHRQAWPLLSGLAAPLLSCICTRQRHIVCTNFRQGSLNAQPLCAPQACWLACRAGAWQECAN
jgi:hypothetical protein